MTRPSSLPHRAPSGQSPAGRETRVMPSTSASRVAPPDGWPETPPTLRATHGGPIALAHLVATVALAVSAAWVAIEVRALREIVAVRGVR